MRTRPAYRLVVCALLLTGAAAVVRAADIKPCSVGGSVINAATGTPIVRAYVSAVNPDETVVVESDAAGRWSVPHIACGKVSLNVNRVGFLRRVESGVLNLVADSPVRDVKLELSPQAVIAGRVLDDQGDPVQGALVSLMTLRVLNGLRTLAASTSTAANDLGEYRFAGLAAGKYLVCATASPSGLALAGGARTFGEKCYPGPLDASPASTMEVIAGYEGRVDFTLMALSAVQVRGVVSGTGDNAASVSLVSRGLPDMSGRMGMTLAAAVRKDGTFTVRNVPPGSYTLTANSLLQNRRLMARTPVNVGGNDVEGVQLRLEPGTTITGTVKILSARDRKFGKFAEVLRSADFGAPQAVWDESGTSFIMSDVIPGSYRLTFAPPPLYLKSATMGGRDIVDSEVTIGEGSENIELVLSDDGGAVEGDVADDKGASVAAWVLLQRYGGQSRNARADTNGHFRFDNIPPGDYKAYAWSDSANVEYANPDWMRRNGTGVALSVQPGQSQQVRLTRQVAASE